MATEGELACHTCGELAEHFNGRGPKVSTSSTLLQHWIGPVEQSARVSRGVATARRGRAEMVRARVRENIVSVEKVVGRVDVEERGASGLFDL